MGFTLHRITSADADLFAQLAEGVFDAPIHPGRLQTYLAQPGHLMVLAVKEGEVIGQCTGVVHHRPDKTDELYVDEVGTATGHLRRGIATAMMAELFAWAKERGCTEAWLGTDLDNAAANALYRRIGGNEDRISYYAFKL